jgi:hypothetical protein
MDGPGAELAVHASLPLNRPVERVDVVVGFGDHGDVLAGGGVGEPAAGRFGDESVDSSGGDAAVADVGVEGVGVGCPQLQGRGLFPAVAEPVDCGQLVRAAGSAQLGEHAAAADGLELAGVADKHQAPLLGHRQVDQIGERAGAHHARLINDKRRPRREPVGVVGCTGAPLVQQLGHRVGRHRGLVA